MKMETDLRDGVGSGLIERRFGRGKKEGERERERGRFGFFKI